jgi:hypothetical protein
MKKLLGLALAVAVTALGLVSQGASAATIGKPEAHKRVLFIEKEHANLLQQLPPLHEVDLVIRSDCAAKVSGHSASDGFCTCAAAVTIQVWRTGVDPKVLAHLSDFIRGTGTLKASDFTQYEGPELYRPLCELGADS